MVIVGSAPTCLYASHKGHSAPAWVPSWDACTHNPDAPRPGKLKWQRAGVCGRRNPWPQPQPHLSLQLTASVHLCRPGVCHLENGYQPQASYPG